MRYCIQHLIYNFVSCEGLSSGLQAFISTLTDIKIPNNVQKVLSHPKWKAIVLEEVQTLEKNGTWEIQKLPNWKHFVRCMWIFTIKHNVDGSINKFKTRLIAKRFSQSYRVEYEETFAPVAKLNSIHALLSLVANMD